VRDKQDLLAQIAGAHVQRLQALVQSLAAQRLPPRQHLTELLLRLMRTGSSPGGRPKARCRTRTWTA
jgi:hypothetical protein